MDSAKKAKKNNNSDERRLVVASPMRTSRLREEKAEEPTWRVSILRTDFDRARTAVLDRESPRQCNNLSHRPAGVSCRLSGWCGEEGEERESEKRTAGRRSRRLVEIPTGKEGTKGSQRLFPYAAVMARQRQGQQVCTGASCSEKGKGRGGEAASAILSMGRREREKLGVLPCAAVSGRRLGRRCAAYNMD